MSAIVEVPTALRRHLTRLIIAVEADAFSSNMSTINVARENIFLEKGQV